MKVIIERFDEMPEEIMGVYSVIVRDGALIVNQYGNNKHGFPLVNVSKWEEIADYDGSEA